MDEQQRNIDEVFRQSLAGYHEVPPGAVWQSIASRLEEEESRRGSFFRRHWVMLSLLIIAGSSWMVVGLNRVSEKGVSLNSASRPGPAGNNALSEGSIKQPSIAH